MRQTLAYDYVNPTKLLDAQLSCLSDVAVKCAYFRIAFEVVALDEGLDRLAYERGIRSEEVQLGENLVKNIAFEIDHKTEFVYPSYLRDELLVFELFACFHNAHDAGLDSEFTIFFDLNKFISKR